MGKTINGIGRFSLSPGNEMFSLEPYPEVSDDVSEWLMVKNETNQSMRLTDKIKTIEDITSFVETPGDHTMKYLTKVFIPMKAVFKFKASPSELNAEATYEKFQSVIENDKAANNFYNGVFDMEVLRTTADAIEQ